MIGPRKHPINGNNSKHSVLWNIPLSLKYPTVQRFGNENIKAGFFQSPGKVWGLYKCWLTPSIAGDLNGSIFFFIKSF